MWAGTAFFKCLQSTSCYLAQHQASTWNLTRSGICRLVQCLACLSPLPHNLLSMSNQSFPFLIYFKFPITVFTSSLPFLPPQPFPRFLPEAPWQIRGLFFSYNLHWFSSFSSPVEACAYVRRWVVGWEWHQQSRVSGLGSRTKAASLWRYNVVLLTWKRILTSLSVSECSCGPKWHLWFLLLLTDWCRIVTCLPS